MQQAGYGQPQQQQFGGMGGMQGGMGMQGGGFGGQSQQGFGQQQHRQQPFPVR